MFNFLTWCRTSNNHKRDRKLDELLCLLRDNLARNIQIMSHLTNLATQIQATIDTQKAVIEFINFHLDGTESTEVAKLTADLRASTDAVALLIANPPTPKPQV